jgi:predicted nucleotidyltransferase
MRILLKGPIKGLNKTLLAQIVKIIVSYKGAEKIVLFGSRAKDAFSKISDIDIAIFAKDWSDRDINIIKHKLDEEVKIPLKFDVMNFYSLSKKSLKQNILKDGRIIYEKN